MHLQGFFFHIKCESCLMRPSEYALVTWLTSPNHDLASVNVFGMGKLNIVSSMDLEGVTPEGVIWRPPNCTGSWQN